MLGLAIAGAGDRVTAERVATPGVRIVEVRDPRGELHDDLSSDSAQNTAGVAATALWQETGQSGGLELRVRKGVPLKSGMGSSAASAVAGAVAANALLDQPLGHAELLPLRDCRRSRRQRLAACGQRRPELCLEGSSCHRRP